MPRDKSINKVLVIGSGPIVIGQAAEFDYAGTQACRVLKDMGVNVVLVNSNPATIMTDQALADEIYLEPLVADTVRRIIVKEKPDGLLATLGGQTGLTIASELEREGFLKAHGVRLLGTGAAAIDKAEDRKLFAETMREIGQPIIPSGIATSVEEAVAVAREIGYPVIVRPAFTLGGTGGGVADDEAALREVAEAGLTLSPIHQALIEKYIYGWKEIEFEALRDSAGNAIAVCSMENVDPVGVHTGDSVVVAPALTLADKELQMLRTAALSIVSALGIEGGCNCQFALDPHSFQYAVIEVNPRLSRSSALASKATGYPIAKVATKIAMGLTLDEIINDVTGETCACFEPAVDYVVVKLPRFPFDKFVGASHALGTQMKATGEVMAIAPSLEMALMKAIRGAEIGVDTLARAGQLDYHKMDDMRLFAVYRALKDGVSIEEIYQATRIDRFFLSAIGRLASAEKEIAAGPLDEQTYLKMKRLGFTDKALARISGHALPAHRSAVYKMVDTCSAEFRALTPYFYSTYDDVCESRERKTDKPCVVVLGSGPIRIGQGIEFDYSSVHCVWTLKDYQQQPGNRFHGFRYRRPIVFRAAHRGRRAERGGGREARGRGRRFRRADRHQAHQGAVRARYSHPGHFGGGHRPGGRPRTVRSSPANVEHPPARRRDRHGYGWRAGRGQPAGLSGAAAPLLRDWRAEHDHRAIGRRCGGLHAPDPGAGH